MTVSWKTFRWRCFLSLAFVSSSSSQALFEFNGRSFSPPKYVDDGNWKPSSLLTFSEHWSPLNERVSQGNSFMKKESSIKRESPPPVVNTGHLPTETPTERITNRPSDSHESVTWYVKTDNRRILSNSDSKDYHNQFQDGYDDFDYLETLKNHNLQADNSYSKRHEPIYGKIKEAVQPGANVQPASYIPDTYSKLKEELQPYYQLQPNLDSQNLDVGTSFSFDGPRGKPVGNSPSEYYFGAPNPQKVKQGTAESSLSSSSPYNTYYTGYNPGKRQEFQTPSSAYSSLHSAVPSRVPSDTSLVNSKYNVKPPYSLPNRPASNIQYHPPKPSIKDRVMDFIYNFQERQGINSDKFKLSERPKPKPNNRDRHRHESDHLGSNQGYDNRPSLRPQPQGDWQRQEPNNRPGRPQSGNDWYQEPQDYAKPSKQRPSYQKPNSLVDRMVETVHTYFQRGYAANKRKPADKFADAGLSTAPIGAVGLAAAVASVVWYGISKSSTPVITARTEGNPVDMELLFSNIDKLEEVIDNAEFMEKYSDEKKSFADMVQEFVKHLAKKDGELIE